MVKIRTISKNNPSTSLILNIFYYICGTNRVGIIQLYLIMRSYYLILILLLVTNYKLSAKGVGEKIIYEEYYKDIIAAEVASAELDYNTALKYYEKAFSENYPYPDDIILAIKCCEKLHDDKKAHELISLLIMSGYKIENTILPFSLCQELPYDNIFPIIEYQDYFNSIYEDVRRLYLKKIDKDNSCLLSSFNTIEEFIISVRRELRSEEDMILLQDVSYNVVYELLIGLFENYSEGMSRKHTDNWLDFKFIMSLIHTAQCTYSDDEPREQFDLFLRTMVEYGNIHPKQYAMIIDGASNQVYGKAVYGEMLTRYDYNREFFPIANIEIIDSIRSKAYLSPLWVKAKGMQIPLPDNYVK